MSGRFSIRPATTADADAVSAEAWLNTEERNRGARRFYESQGWVENGPARVRDWHGVRLVEPRYAKRLQPTTSSGCAPAGRVHVPGRGWFAG